MFGNLEEREGTVIHSFFVDFKIIIKKRGERSGYPSPYFFVGWKGEEMVRCYLNWQQSGTNEFGLILLRFYQLVKPKKWSTENSLNIVPLNSPNSRELKEGVLRGGTPNPLSSFTASLMKTSKQGGV